MLASNPNPVSAEAYNRQAQAYIKFDILNQLGKITVPTIVITGERDRLTPPWIGEEVANTIPNAKFVVLKGPGTSHVLPLEKPKEFNELVLDYLAGISE